MGLFLNSVLYPELHSLASAALTISHSVCSLHLSFLKANFTDLSCLPFHINVNIGLVF